MRQFVCSAQWAHQTRMRSDTAFAHQQATNRQRSATYQLTEHSLTLTILHVRGCGRVHHCHSSTAQHSIEVHADHHHHHHSGTFCPTRAKLQPHSKLLAPNSKPSSVQTSPDPSVWSSDLVSPHYERKVPSLPPDRTFHSKWSISNLLFRKWWWGKHMETKKSQHTLNRKCSNVTNKLNYPIHSKIQ